MTSEEKEESADAIRYLKNAIASMVATGDERERIVRSFPKCSGLGTDGTCWADGEHHGHWVKVLTHGLKLLEEGE